MENESEKGVERMCFHNFNMKVFRVLIFIEMKVILLRSYQSALLGSLKNFCTCCETSKNHLNYCVSMLSRYKTLRTDGSGLFFFKIVTLR